MAKVLGNFLMVAGVIAILLGLILRHGKKLQWIGKLPGDIVIHKGNFTFYFPLATGLLLSLLLSLVLFLAFRLFGRN